MKKKKATLGDLKDLAAEWGFKEWEPYPELGVYGFKFKSYAALEEFFLANVARFNEWNINTKVIGKKIFLFGKGKEK